VPEPLRRPVRDPALLVVPVVVAPRGVLRGERPSPLLPPRRTRVASAQERRDRLDGSRLAAQLDGALAAGGKLCEVQLDATRLQLRHRTVVEERHDATDRHRQLQLSQDGLAFALALALALLARLARSLLALAVCAAGPGIRAVGLGVGLGVGLAGLPPVISKNGPRHRCERPKRRLADLG